MEQTFPGKGREFANLWRTRQFEYTWLRSITNRYVDFFAVTEDALVYTANVMKLELTAQQKWHLLDAYLHLTPWPDTAAALRRLRESGIRVITLANFSPTMLRSNAENAGLTGLFEALVSTDANHTYKSRIHALIGWAWTTCISRGKTSSSRLSVDGTRRARSRFGYPTVWVNRFNQPAEELGIRPDQTFSDLNGLLDFVLNKPLTQ